MAVIFLAPQSWEPYGMAAWLGVSGIGALRVLATEWSDGIRDESLVGKVLLGTAGLAFVAASCAMIWVKCR